MLEQRVLDLEAELKSLRQTRRKAESIRTQHMGFLDFLPYPVLIRDTQERITYVNPAFTRTFKWTLEELRGTTGKQYVPVYLRSQLNARIKAMLQKDTTLRMKTRRLTKDGKMLKVAMRVGIQKDQNQEPAAIISVLRDITMEDRIDKNREAVNRISLALPQYPELRKLLSYITHEIKDLLKAEVANIILLDSKSREFFFLSSGHDDPLTREKIEKIRLSVDDMLSGQVIKTGKPMIVTDAEDQGAQYRLRDQKLGYQVKNVILVPLRIQDRIIGVLTADNKTEGQFDQTDLETMSTIAGTVALSIENARVTRELRKAYEDLKGLNAAKDKMIHHLSHELKTPVAVLLSSVTVLSRRLSDLPEDTWKPTIERIKRNLNRILEIQYEVDDIIKQKDTLPGRILTMILDQCKDELESLIAEHTGEKDVIKKVREKVNTLFWPRDPAIEDIALDQFVRDRLEKKKPLFSHRRIKIVLNLSPSPLIRMPADPLKKIIDGLVKNAVENTPDQGKITITVGPGEKGTFLDITDEGTGIVPEAQKHIFEGFFATQDTLKYSSKNPYDFNAGGKGADLLRMKIFSERFNFTINLSSRRCSNLLEAEDVCPGSVEKCSRVSAPGRPGCDGTTTVKLVFPS